MGVNLSDAFSRDPKHDTLDIFVHDLNPSAVRIVKVHLEGTSARKFPFH